MKSDDTRKPFSSDLSLLSLVGVLLSSGDDPSLAGSKLKITVESSRDLLDPEPPPPFYRFDELL